MFMPTAEESAASSAGPSHAPASSAWTTPCAAGAGPPRRSSPRTGPLGLSEVANAYCTTGRDVYARRVLDVTPEPNEKMLLGGALHNTFRDWTVHAKKILYACGAGRTEEAMQEIQDIHLRTSPKPASSSATNRRHRVPSARDPRPVPPHKDRRPVAQVLPVTLGAMLDGAFLSRRLSTDLLNLGEPCILNIIFNDEKRTFTP